MIALEPVEAIFFHRTTCVCALVSLSRHHYHCRRSLVSLLGQTSKRRVAQVRVEAGRAFPSPARPPASGHLQNVLLGNVSFKPGCAYCVPHASCVFPLQQALEDNAIIARSVTAVLLWTSYVCYYTPGHLEPTWPSSLLETHNLFTPFQLHHGRPYLHNHDEPVEPCSAAAALSSYICASQVFSW